MRHLRLFPKFFLYTLGIMLFPVALTHALIYLLAPRMQFTLESAQAPEALIVSIDQTELVTMAVKQALPFSLGISLPVLIVCSLLLARAVSVPIRHISAATGHMRTLAPDAACDILTNDEIGQLAQNVNALYESLLSSMKRLQQEKEHVRDMERARADFLRAASHELKTPVTALCAILENMLLDVGEYRDHAAWLPECHELATRLAGMIHEILETSRLHAVEEPAAPVDLAVLLTELCEPYRLIAKAHGITFLTDLPASFPAVLKKVAFQRAVSNVLANAVTYTKAGKRVLVRSDGRSLVIENECEPLPEEEIRRLSEPFYRPDFSRSRETGGNGLGLYITDTLLHSMHIPYSFAAMEDPPGMRFTASL